MNSGKNLEILFQHALECRFSDFDTLCFELEGRLSAEELAEAYLMRAQIRLWTADSRLADDLERAGKADFAPRFPCLGDRWQPDSPNRFVVFPKAPGALQDFLQTLSVAEGELGKWYGEAGGGMARQMQSEVLYFQGRFSEALELAERQVKTVPDDSVSAMACQYVQFRCHLAVGAAAEAEECMLNMIRTARVDPDCQDSYQTVRDWANLTTGWSGDTPRFHHVPHGEALPVLDDRLVAIRKGISRLSGFEEPFAEYAAGHYEGAYTLRQYYMDVFHAIYWFQAGDSRQAETIFLQAHQMSLDSGLLMPFVEYGKQIIPLLEHVQSGQGASPDGWFTLVLSQAEEYEKNLDAYRA